MTISIDAHVHLWQVARGDYGWLTPDLTAIYMAGEWESIGTQLAAPDAAVGLTTRAKIDFRFSRITFSSAFV